MEVETGFTVPLGSITLVTRTVLGIFSEHSLGWGVCRALSFDREVLILRDFTPGLMALRDLSSGWGVLRNLSPGWMVLRDLSSDRGDLGDLSKGLSIFLFVFYIAERQCYVGCFIQSHQSSFKHSKL